MWTDGSDMKKLCESGHDVQVSASMCIFVMCMRRSMMWQDEISTYRGLG